MCAMLDFKVLEKASFLKKEQQKLFSIALGKMPSIKFVTISFS